MKVPLAQLLSVLVLCLPTVCEAATCSLTNAHPNSTGAVVVLSGVVPEGGISSLVLNSTSRSAEVAYGSTAYFDCPYNELRYIFVINTAGEEILPMHLAQDGFACQATNMMTLEPATYGSARLDLDMSTSARRIDAGLVRLMLLNSGHNGAVLWHRRNSSSSGLWTEIGETEEFDQAIYEDIAFDAASTYQIKAELLNATIEENGNVTFIAITDWLVFNSSRAQTQLLLNLVGNGTQNASIASDWSCNAANNSNCEVCPPPSPAPTEIVFGDLIELAIECTSNDGVPLSYTWDVKRVYEAAIGYCLGANNLTGDPLDTCSSCSITSSANSGRRSSSYSPPQSSTGRRSELLVNFGAWITTNSYENAVSAVDALTPEAIMTAIESANTALGLSVATPNVQIYNGTSDNSGSPLVLWIMAGVGFVCLIGLGIGCGWWCLRRRQRKLILAAQQRNNDACPHRSGQWAEFVAPPSYSEWDPVISSSNVLTAMPEGGSELPPAFDDMVLPGSTERVATALPAEAPTGAAVPTGVAIGAGLTMGNVVGSEADAGVDDGGAPERRAPPVIVKD